VTGSLFEGVDGAELEGDGLTGSTSCVTGSFVGEAVREYSIGFSSTIGPGAASEVGIADGEDCRDGEGKLSMTDLSSASALDALSLGGD